MSFIGLFLYIVSRCNNYLKNNETLGSAALVGNLSFFSPFSLNRYTIRS